MHSKGNSACFSFLRVNILLSNQMVNSAGKSSFYSIYICKQNFIFKLFWDNPGNFVWYPPWSRSLKAWKMEQSSLHCFKNVHQCLEFLSTRYVMGTGFGVNMERQSVFKMLIVLHSLLQETQSKTSSLRAKQCHLGTAHSQELCGAWLPHRKHWEAFCLRNYMFTYISWISLMHWGVAPGLLKGRGPELVGRETACPLTLP